MNENDSFKYDITVVMLTYNHSRSIERAISSVISQEFDMSIELIISDDASTDGTQEIIRRLSPSATAKFTLSSLFNEKNVGASANFVTTLKQSNGRYIAYLEGDDYWIDNKHLQRSFNSLVNNPNAVLVSSGYDYVDANFQMTGVSHRVTSAIEVNVDSEWPYFPHLGSSMWVNTYLYNVPDDICKIMDDNLMWTFLCPLGLTIFLPYTVLHYVQTGNGLWTRNSAAEKSSKLMAKTRLINDLHIQGLIAKPLKLSGNLSQCLYWTSASGDVGIYTKYLFEYLEACFIEKTIDISLILRLTLRVLYRKVSKSVCRH